MSLERFAGELRAWAIGEARSGRLTARGPLRERVEQLVARDAPALPADTRSRLVERVIAASAGFGPLEPLLGDPEIDEIMVNGPGSVWVERRGALERTDVAFGAAAELDDLIERMIAPLGRRVDEASPICDARLPDGSRVNIVIPPLSLGGPQLTIRRFRHAKLDPESLVANGTLSRRAHDFLAEAVARRCSVLVSGGTGSGKTTTLNALSAFVPEGERIVTIEDAAELRLRQGHVVRLEARPANLEGRGEVTIRALVRTALRMRPDRIVVGEVRGGEALDMLSALTTGHDGGLTTIHANSPQGAIERVQTLAMMAGLELPHEAVRRISAAAIDLIVHQRRAGGGRRRVDAIAEVRTARGEPVVSLVMERRDGREIWSAPEDARLAAADTLASGAAR